MDKKTKFKEAFKIALAFALVYAIALKVNWLSPSWAGWSVIAIAASSSGQSINKGILRLAGTLFACLVGLGIISIAAQERFLFMGLTAVWLFIASYMMQSSKSRSYFWFVAGYVCLVITAAGPSPLGGFYVAVFRSMDTALGIIVYTLVTVFIWPNSNLGSIKKTANGLLNTQAKLLEAGFTSLLGNIDKRKLDDLHLEEVKQIDQLHAALEDEGSESYEVQELKKYWAKFQFLEKSLTKSIDKLLGGFSDLSEQDINLFIPDLKSYYTEIQNRLTDAADLLSGNPPIKRTESVKPTLNQDAISTISHFDRAALAIIKKELEQIDKDSRLLHAAAMQIAGYEASSGEKEELAKTKIAKDWYSYLVPDIDHLKGALFVAVAIVTGFLIWFYLNPPGHSTLYILAGTFALLFATAPQIKPIKLLIPFLLAMVCTSLLYIFLMPTFTNVVELCTMLFVIMFITQYYFSGPVTLVFTVIILQSIAVDNPQTFDISKLANGYVFIVLLMVLLYLLSYIISSPRPEKSVLNLVDRFFRGARRIILIKHDQTNKNRLYQSIKIAFYLQVLRTTPQKILAWGKAIDTSLFPSTNLDQIKDLANSLEVLAMRLEILLEANLIADQEDELLGLFNNWKVEIESAFGGWKNLVNEESDPERGQEIEKMMATLEGKVEKIKTSHNADFSTKEDVQFYNILGGFKGVTEATISFLKAANLIGWSEWKEERFE